MKNKKKDNREVVKAARITGAATIVAAIIGGLILVIMSWLSLSPTKNNRQVKDIHLDEILEDPSNDTIRVKKNLSVDNNKQSNPKSDKAKQKKNPITTFLLVLDSDQINSKVLVNGKQGRIIKGHNTSYQSIAIDSLNSIYKITIVYNGKICETTTYISSNNQRIYPCEQ